VRNRTSDVVGRYGGDEFMILLPNTNLENAVRVAARIAANLRKAKVQGWDKELSCSIGVAGTPSDNCEYEELKRKADQALYLSKAKGRNTASSSLELM
jgi:diguanylate cyclase (GGDEF)-like protein